MGVLSEQRVTSICMKYSLWDGVLCRLYFAEEFLGCTVIKGELAIKHSKEDHAKSPHVTGFTAVRSTWKKIDKQVRSECVLPYGKCGWNSPKNMFLDLGKRQKLTL